MASVMFKESRRHRVGDSMELFLRFYHGSAIDTQVLSGIVVPVAAWDQSRQRLVGASRRYVSKASHELIELQSRMEALKVFVLDRWVADSPVRVIDRAWLEKAVRDFHSGLGSRCSGLVLVSDMIPAYVRDADLLPGTSRQYFVLQRMLERFAVAVHPLYVDNVSVQDLNLFVSFLREEHLSDASAGERSQNTINSKMRRFKAVCNWLVETDRAESNPFAKFKIAEDVYGTPIFLTLEERDAFAAFPFEKECDRQQRDVFVFQCHVGCRVSDLMSLKPGNVGEDGVLSYIQTKLRRSNPQEVRVPLSEAALQIIERYRGKCGPLLLPVISDVKYNVAIKKLLREAGICRLVLVQDKQTYQNRLVPICDVASSHMARRTFMANMYRVVKSERIVSSFTGHVAGSQAFKRYTTVDDEMKREIVENVNRGKK